MIWVAAGIDWCYKQACWQAGSFVERSRSMVLDYPIIGNRSNIWISLLLFCIGRRLFCPGHSKPNWYLLCRLYLVGCHKLLPECLWCMFFRSNSPYAHRAIRGRYRYSCMSLADPYTGKDYCIRLSHWWSGQFHGRCMFSIGIVLEYTSSHQLFHRIEIMLRIQASGVRTFVALLECLVM